MIVYIHLSKLVELLVEVDVLGVIEFWFRWISLKPWMTSVLQYKTLT